MSESYSGKRTGQKEAGDPREQSPREAAWTEWKKHHETQERDSSTNSIQQETQNEGKETQNDCNVFVTVLSVSFCREYCVKVVLQLHPLSLSFGRMPDVTQKNTTSLPLKHDTLSLSLSLESQGRRDDGRWQTVSTTEIMLIALWFSRKESERSSRHRLKEQEEEERRGWCITWFIF